MDREETWNGCCVDEKEGEHASKRKRNEPKSGQESKMLGSKSVLGKWLQDFRSGQKEKKACRPLGRTLSANTKNEGSRKKPARTMSANQKDKRLTEPENRFPCRREKKKSDLCERNGENVFPHKSGKEESRGFFLVRRTCDFYRHLETLENRSDLAVNPDALVSYLDEEGLNVAGKETKRPTRSAYCLNRDGFIMPISCHGRKDRNCYQNQKTLVLNEKNSSSIRFETEKSKPRVHDYENLTVKRQGKAREKSEDSRQLTRECRFRFGDDEDEGDGDDDEHARPDGIVSEAPVRDPSSLRSVKYGPGHEKYPSWPGSLRTACEKPQRSRSWTDRTDYRKEKATAYARPCDKKPNPTFTNQLKTVMERCEKISRQTFRGTTDRVQQEETRVYLPQVDREGKSLGDEDYMVPSPPERDEPYGRSRLEIYYRGGNVFKDDADYSTPYEDVNNARFTRADLEEYVRSYEGIPRPHHQHEGSYAQSEGYHSYVSTSELAITSFSDKSNRESEQRSQWEQEGSAGRDSVVTTSSGSAGSSETLKWHGSMSDVSIGGSSCRSRQLIAHSSRVPPPQRHHSESILYLGNKLENPSMKVERSQHLKLFPVNTYTVRPFEETSSVISSCVPRFSVAERISELERQQQFYKLTNFDPGKRHRVSDPTLKAIQKKALLSFYERHQHSSGLPAESQEKSCSLREQETNRSEHHCNSVHQQEKIPERTCNRLRSKYSSDADRGSIASSRSISGRPRLPDPFAVFRSRSTTCPEEPAPERPPKKPRPKPVLPPPPLPPRSPSPIRIASESEDRLPTPDLPPPPFPACLPEDQADCDEPLPPPPPEAEWLLATAVPGRSSPRASVRPLDRDPDEIQYDQNAINAIMECNRASEDCRPRKYGSKKNKSGDEEERRRKNRVENRPPLPLPRDAITCSFLESEIRSSANFEIDGPVSAPSWKPCEDRSKKSSRHSQRTPSFEENFANENFLRLEKEDRFRRLFLERTNSKAAFLAVRREKELGLTNYEGSYKLTISPSGEFINAGHPTSSTSPFSSKTIEKIDISTERVILEERLSPLPPDLIPLGDLRSRRSSEEYPECEQDNNKFSCGFEEKKANAHFRKFLGKRKEEISFSDGKKEKENENDNNNDNDVSLGADFLEKPAETDLSADRTFSGEFFDRDDVLEESECERLSRDLASQLPPSDKLQGLLVLDSERKRSTDYVAGLFRLELGSGSRRRLCYKSRSRKLDVDHLEEKSFLIDDDFVRTGKGSSFDSSLPESETGTTTTTCHSESSAFLDAGQLEKKKEELTARLDKKLEILRQERIALSEECCANDQLGASVAASVSKLAKPSEAAKYRLHVEETGKITSLLLGLSGRLARTENVLAGLALHDEQRKMHENKRGKLKEQLAEAKQLKENIDKRSDSMAKTLEKYLTKDEFADYLHFIRMKSKLIVDSREIADKISLGEEQLAALKETLSS